MITERNKYLSELEILKRISSQTVLSPETLEKRKSLLSLLEKEQEEEEVISYYYYIKCLYIYIYTKYIRALYTFCMCIVLNGMLQK